MYKKMLSTKVIRFAGGQVQVDEGRVSARKFLASNKRSLTELQKEIEAKKNAAAERDYTLNPAQAVGG
jgi:hypothetical protein